MVYVRFTKSAGVVSWFPFINCFSKIVQGNSSVRISSQILGPKNETISLPLLPAFTLGHLKVF